MSRSREEVSLSPIAAEATHSRVDESIDVSEGLGASLRRVSYGPSMLTKKFKPKSKNPPLNSGDLGRKGKIFRNNQKSSLNAMHTSGSRFSVLDTHEEEGSVGHVSTKEITRETPSNGPVSMMGDQSPEPKNGGVSTPVKVRNASGGKNPQFGPRLRDAKKTARGLGLQKKGRGLRVGSTSPLKENVHPNKKDKGKQKSPYKDVSLLVQELPDEEQKKLLASVRAPSRDEGASATTH